MNSAREGSWKRLWLVGAALALSWGYRIRTRTASGDDVTNQTVNTTMLFFASLFVSLTSGECDFEDIPDGRKPEIARRSRMIEIFGKPLCLRVVAGCLFLGFMLISEAFAESVNLVPAFGDLYFGHSRKDVEEVVGGLSGNENEALRSERSLEIAGFPFDVEVYISDNRLWRIDLIGHEGDYSFKKIEEILTHKYGLPNLESDRPWSHLLTDPEDLSDGCVSWNRWGLAEKTVSLEGCARHVKKTATERLGGEIAKLGRKVRGEFPRVYSDYHSYFWTKIVLVGKAEAERRSAISSDTEKRGMDRDAELFR